jgi:hypothetical protein
LITQHPNIAQGTQEGRGAGVSLAVAGEFRSRFHEAAQREAEGIPLDEVVCALMLTKYHLRDYIRSAGLIDSAEDLYHAPAH